MLKKRIKADGLNIHVTWNEIEEMIIQCKALEHVSKGIIVADNFGIRGWFMELLENTPI